MGPKPSAANTAANAAALALAATGTPHGRVPKRQAPTPPGLRDLSEAVLWAQTEAFEEAAWARRAAELSDADALERADAAVARYEWRCSVLAELFDGVPVSQALEEKEKRRGRTAEKGGEEPCRSLAETVRALEREAAAETASTSAPHSSSSSSSAAAAAAAAAAAGASSEFEALLSQLSRARTRAEVSAAEEAYLSFRARRRRRGGGGGSGQEEREAPRARSVAAAAATRRRTVGPGLFEIFLGGSGSGSGSGSAAPVPDPPAGPGLEL